ncbi:ribonuclease H [Senna tora]|uniref:Ribonuclease H n=1 Tax=Senna tora TaxID=362788 RepID=A0A834W914_9FABA|nr:ribonuclease H [Senna tora]
MNQSWQSKLRSNTHMALSTIGKRGNLSRIVMSIMLWRGSRRLFHISFLKSHDRTKLELSRNWLPLDRLIELPSKGNQFTWTNNRTREDAVCEKLDRALCNASWVNKYPLSLSEAFPIAASEHSPICVTMDNNVQKAFFLLDCIHNAKENLKSLQVNPQEQQVREQERVVKHHLEHLLDCEQALWAQRAHQYQMDGSKAPGPEGFPPMFYLQCWPLIENDIFLCVAEYQPIGLCKVSCKVISKVLTNRLQEIMNDLTAPFQSAFVKGRNIADNILVASEVLNYIRRNKKETLRGMHVLERWVRLRMQCVTKTSLWVLVNGKPSNQFVPQCGLRQGDPLSSYLFIMGFNVFSQVMINAQLQRKLPEEAFCMLQDFGEISGLKLNLKKCEHLQDRLKTWKSIMLLQASRLTLIKSVLTSMPIYHMAYYKLSTLEADNLYILGAWESRICMILTQPYLLNNFGGLLITPPVSTVQSCSVSMVILWSLEISIALLMPLLVGGIYSSKELILLHLKWVIGTGDKFAINNPCWFQTISNSGGITRVSQLIDHAGYWKRSVVNSMYNAKDANIILKLPTSRHQNEDQIVWEGNFKGKYTVRDSYNMLRIPNYRNLNNLCFQNWQLLWRLKTPPKILNFAWKLGHESFPLGQNLLRRGFKIQGTCSFGCSIIENIQHLFCDCHFARAVWMGSLLGLLSSNIGDSFMDWINNLLQQAKKDYVETESLLMVEQVLIFAWYIYNKRNKTLFQNVTSNPYSTIAMALRIFEDIALSRKDLICHGNLQDRAHRRNSQLISNALQDPSSLITLGRDIKSLIDTFNSIIVCYILWSLPMMPMFGREAGIRVHLKVTLVNISSSVLLGFTQT